VKPEEIEPDTNEFIKNLDKKPEESQSIYKLKIINRGISCKPSSESLC